VTIPIPPSQCKWFEGYIKAMGETPFRTRLGSLYRLTSDKVMKGAFCPVVEDRTVDLREATISALLMNRQLWMIEHPWNMFTEQEVVDTLNFSFSGKRPTIRYTEQATYLVPLKREDWKPNKKVRQNVRNFAKAGGELEMVETGVEMEKYHELYLESREALKLEPWPKGCFEEIERQLGRNAYVVYASMEREMVAAMAFLIGKGWVSEVHVARKELDGVYPMEAIRMRGIEHARELGHDYYNLGGVNPNAEPGSKDEGIRRNKAKYEGEYHKYRRYFVVGTE
jgi:hypothetical protein